MTAQASPRGPLKERITVAAMAAWLVVTVVSQHPDRGFDKLRKADPIGLLIPNWRFFAPEPAVDDTHLLYRFHSPETGEYSQWYSANQAQQRKLVHAFWFPGRREEKAVFDVTAGLLSNVNSGISASETRQLSAFSLLSNYVRRAADRDHPLAESPEFSQVQWLIARFSGYSEVEDVAYDYVSPVLSRSAVETEVM